MPSARPPDPTCARCNDTGWIGSDSADGIAIARRCECLQRKPDARRDPFTEADLDWACEELSMCVFWKEAMRAPVRALLGRICPHRAALYWLVCEIVNHINEWPGPAELRGLLCTRFDPEDGIDRPCNLPGYSPDDQEAKYIVRHEQIKRAEPQLTGEAQQMIQQLSSGLKRIK